jgi:predicted phage-related endonuclease
MPTDEIINIGGKLWKEQTKKNWEAFAKAIDKSPIEYYKIVFANEGKLNKMQDLTKSYAELYDAKHKIVTKVPVFMKTGKKVDGATIYLVGLTRYKQGV